MEEFRKDEITYDEDWQCFDEPVVSEQKQIDNCDVESDKKPENTKPKKMFPALITIQLVVCLVIAFLVFMLKAMNSQTYAQFCDWYNELMSDTLLSNSTFEDIDLSQYFEATTDQVSATNDEIQHK